LTKIPRSLDNTRPKCGWRFFVQRDDPFSYSPAQYSRQPGRIPVLCLLAVIPWQYAGRRQNSVQLQSESSLLIEKIRKTVDGHWFGAILAYSLSSYFCQLGAGEIYYSSSVYDISLIASLAWVTAVGLTVHEIRPKQQPVHSASASGIRVAGLGMTTRSSCPCLCRTSRYGRGRLRSNIGNHRGQRRRPVTDILP
jgi:hypothetical protein